jgi:hypothetical protein
LSRILGKSSQMAADLLCCLGILSNRGLQGSTCPHSLPLNRNDRVGILPTLRHFTDFLKQNALHSKGGKLP